ncbi:hypothetical protein SYK_23970 [Pseudodesulfovibrio nedwellii]|uniref:Uncharacterized protein n=2 Tax=Pseudodesulfovibrio nedwellii TaxID=2973072 RepID=A0ABM8B371_9BACT|nr:hypothetical protein SYK_23970 [Pseudodesulfovibrio nedwellii]
MRPDFTISVWAEEITSEEAELNNSICHVHFDTKYSVSDIMTVLGHPNEEVDVIKKEERFGCYRRGDLLKMHSYKDAIRRTHGAYIIYPGNSSKYSQGPKGYHAWLEFHEVLPGLGAFQISPGVNSDQSAKVLHGFLLDILDQFVLKESKLSQTNCLIGEINK